MKILELNEQWRLHEEPLSFAAEKLCDVLRETNGWLDCSLPCDIHMPLAAAGIIKDPVLADYCFDSEWVERRSWWFVREFDSKSLDMDAEVIELCIDSIDSYGEVFVNGEPAGTHCSAHYPFICDIKSLIIPGKNILCVRATSGLESVSDQDLAELNWAVCSEASNGCPERGDLRRAFVRRPQYTVGWDWGPKVITIGIVKGARIRCLNKAVIRGVNLAAVRLADSALLRMTVEIELLDIISTRDADIYAVISKDGRKCAAASVIDTMLTSGVNYVDMDITLDRAELWWPAGYGAQPLYDVSVRVDCEGSGCEYPVFKYGVRTITVDTSRDDGENRKFTLIVNGNPIFCKGGDWIPADSIYARVTGEKYDRLVTEAAAANFNMLRVWGGGIYERDEFYEACDRYGILLWHDFMFACSTYPDHREWFRELARKEISYQTARLRNHACLGLWCGNNEDHWIFNAKDNQGWGIEISQDKQFGLYISNVTAKEIIRANCPQIPYWNSSPYGGPLPNAPNIGDTHHWHQCMMNPNMEKRINPKEYDKVESRFVTEYGYPGPCPQESIRDYFDGRPIDAESNIWRMHTNTFEKHTVAAGIEKQYNVDAQKLDLEQYILYAGMTQSLMLGYSLESIRFKDFCSGALFWMYNDTWGEVGWTIIDYYLRRKISFYGVKRALAHHKLIIRAQWNLVSITGCNDGPDPVRFTAEAGYMALDGSTREFQTIEVNLPPHSRMLIDGKPLPDRDYRKGVFAVIPDHPQYEPVWLRMMELRKMDIRHSEPLVSDCRRDGENLAVVVESGIFAHGVHLNGPYICSDNYFDLLPGERKTILIEKAGDLIPEFTALI